jgi:hypothetical protein
VLGVVGVVEDFHEAAVGRSNGLILMSNVYGKELNIRKCNCPH